MENPEDTFCNLCKVPLNDVGSKQSHFNGKKHKIAMHNAHITDIKEKHSVFITGFPNQIKKENIESFVATLGPVSDIFIGNGNRFAIVQFKDAKVAENLISIQKTYYMGKPLFVKPRKMREINPSDQAKPEEDFDHVLEMLRERSSLSLSDNIKSVIHQLQPRRDVKLIAYQRLLADLQGTLMEIFPWCSVHIFGSTITGLDFNNSDIDAYVAVPNAALLMKPNENYAVTFVKMAGAHLYRRSKIFSHVHAIPKAKTPIVKCIHRQTGIACDFNFKNMLGVCNTVLITYYLSLDVKLKPLAIILKCWAKIQELIKTGGKLSSYSLTLMLIFYLQQNEYNLPSVSALQQHRQYDNFQENWNGGFNHVIKSNSLTLKIASYQEILLGFFTFYSKFNFNLNVISPFFGKPIPKAAFLKSETLPACYDLYRYNLSRFDPIYVETPICIQDPFEQNHNTTRGVSAKFLEEFVSLCNNAVSILQSPSTNHLLRLYTDEAEIVSDKMKLTDTNCEFKINMSSHIAYLEAISSKENKSIENVWFDRVNTFLIMVLIRVFKIDVSAGDNGSLGKTKKMNGQSDVHEGVVDIARLQCVGKRNFWEARKSVARDLAFDECKTEMDRQCFITQYMDENLLKGAESDTPILDFAVTVKAMQNPTRMELNIVNKDKGKAFKNFCLYFGRVLPHWLGRHELESDASFKAAAAAESVETVDLT